MAYVSKNNAYSTLVAGITAVQTSLQVAAGHGDRFPVVAGSDYTYVTLEDTSGNIEIVKVTARASASDTMTIVRAQEGTTARVWNSGDVVEHRLTAGVMEAGLNAANNLTTHLADTTAAHAASAISYAGGTGLSATDVEAAIDELATEKANASDLSSYALAADLTSHLADTTAAHAASAISYAGGTGLSATDVEAAIDELATEKADAGAITKSKITMATSRLLGRTTASTGAVEELSVGTGLTLAGGTLSASGTGGAVKQIVSTTIAAAYGTTAIPDDDTAPLSTEGTQVASLTITPSSASNKIRLSADWSAEIKQGQDPSVLGLIVAVFRGTTLVGSKRIFPNASGIVDGRASVGAPGSFLFVDSPGVTTATTYSIRVGVVGAGSVVAPSWYFNRTLSSATALGSSLANSRFVAEEIT